MATGSPGIVTPAFRPARATRGKPARVALALLAALLPWLTGCGHKQKHIAAAPPPVLAAPARATTAPSQAEPPPADAPADLAFVEAHSPIWTQTGVASWYGPPYDRHRGANGEIFDQNLLSAAHRELPLGALLRVTNLRTGQSAILRVTDRGPFVPGRVLDLSVAAAKAIGVWLPGTATVRIEVFASPRPIAQGGRWCVQIGAFHDESKALKLQHSLARRYSTANVIEFTGPTGHWVRIRPQGDDKARAEEIASSLEPEQGAAYLTRLD